jgi:GNAT superfamily N-acetyltransferase
MEGARPAREDDRPACRELLARALRETRSARGGEALAGAANCDELLERWMDARPRESSVYVGEFHDVVVGLAVATASGSTGRIECCYVEEGARGVGVGTALMESMVAWCTERGCRDMDALALPGDRLTKQRLEAAGFSARLLVLNRPLS